MELENILFGLFLFIALILSLLVNAYQLKIHYKEKEDIFAKFMAKSLGEAEYFKKVYPQEMKEELEKMKKDREREKELTAGEIAASRAAEQL